MKKKKVLIPILAVAAVIVVAVIIALISGDYGTEKYTGDLYFFNESETAIVAESREIKYRDRQDLIENVIKKLIGGPDNRKYSRIIEKKTRLLSVSDIDTEHIVVNFSREFITGNNTKDLLAVYAVVKSLCAIDNIQSVKVVIEGKDILSSDGSIIGYLSNEDINLPTDTYNSEIREVTLYFPKKSGDKLVKERRAIKITDQQPIAQYIINEIIKGPTDKSLSSAISSDTVLISVETSGNICFVNFRSNFLDKNTGSAQQEKLAVYAIVDSLTELDTVNRVQFLIDGKRVDNFGNINIRSMFGRDESVIETQ
jgi:germination protein M